MDYITFDTIQKLQSVGFTYPEYEHCLNHGMLFYYNGDEYTIGGFTMDSFSALDEEVAKHGQWLPYSSHLFKWLEYTDFTVSVLTDSDGYFSVQATDLINNEVYSCGGITLANALAKLIYKILKSKKRTYLPREAIVAWVLQDKSTT